MAQKFSFIETFRFRCPGRIWFKRGPWYSKLVSNKVKRFSHKKALHLVVPVIFRRRDFIERSQVILRKVSYCEKGWQRRLVQMEKLQL